MKVKDFIIQALNDICTGVEEARKTVHEKSNAVINPTGVHYSHPADSTVFFIPRRGLIQSVEFDVVLTVEKEGEVGAGLKIYLAELGGKGKLTKESMNRVKFTVPVLLPHTPYKEDEV